MSKTFQKVFLFFLLSTFIISCDKTNEEEIIVPKAKLKLVEFGFNIHDFNIVNDTIKSGDTFGSLIEKQNLSGRKVYDIVAKVKDTFDVRRIRIGKTITILRSKDRTNKIQILIYQPDRLNFYVIDFRDSIIVYKKAKPLTFKTRTIAGALNDSR
jgi:hypothetical protein